MSLDIPGQKFQLGRKQKKLLRQDIIKFGEISTITEAGAPAGNQELNTLWFNGADRALYIRTNFKLSNMPTLGWYKCDNITGTSLQDFSGNGRAATVTSTTTAPGFYGSALSFDGTDDKVEFPANLAFPLDTDCTMSFWLKIPALANGEKIYILERYKDATHYFKLYITGVPGDASALLKVDWENGGGLVTEPLSNVIGLNEWYFLELYHRSTGADIYALKTLNSDGTVEDLDTEATTFPDLGFTTETYTMGYSQKDTSFGDQPFLIDDIKFWDTLRDITDNEFYPTQDADYRIDLSNLDKDYWIKIGGDVVGEINPASSI